MPECNRCRRTFPSAEVRRTPTGHVCKDRPSCQRRLSELRRSVGDCDQATTLEGAWDALAAALTSRDPIQALVAVRRVSDALGDLAADVLERAARETNLTQKRLAQAVGVPESTLSGLRRYA